jgi:hypothetical protein
MFLRLRAASLSTISNFKVWRLTGGGHESEHSSVFMYQPYEEDNDTYQSDCHTHNEWIDIEVDLRTRLHRGEETIERRRTLRVPDVWWTFIC